jgi:hypothetical protein
MTGGSAFVDFENKTYEAANPGAGKNAEDLMSSSVSGVYIETNSLDADLRDLIFDINYGPGDLPADYLAYFGGKGGSGYVDITYDPNNQNKITGVWATIVVVPEPTSGALLGVGMLILVCRRWLSMRMKA